MNREENQMKLFYSLSCLLLLAPCVSAQYLREYLFGGPALYNGILVPQPTGYGILPLPGTPATATGFATGLIVGGGLEYRFTRCAGAGFDLAGLAPLNGVSPGFAGTLSPSFLVHWPSADVPHPRHDWFASAGYTGFFRNFYANGIKTGAGLNYWFQERLGGTFEFRFVNLIGAVPPTGASRYYEFRVGFTFR
jgi:hypothetical protein